MSSTTMLKCVLFGTCFGLAMAGSLAASSQSDITDFIMLGKIKVTSRTTKTELLETLRNGYAVRNMTPTTDATVAPGYSIYLIWLADAAADDKSLPQGKPVAEATFTNETSERAARSLRSSS